MPQQVFDTYAKAYDDHFTNSGTGEDALWLEKQGGKVLATDISEGMISVAKKKSDKTTIEFKQLDCKHIGSLKPNTYNLIFSNFGGLNCLSKNELKSFEEGCSALQNKHDHLAFVIMSSNCWWEKFYFEMKKDRTTANRRQTKNGVDTIIDSNHFKTYYYSPYDIIDIFRPSPLDYSCHHLIWKAISKRTNYYLDS